METLIAAFYKFVDLPDFAIRREPLMQICLANGVSGTILLAPEGLNSTIAGPEQGVLNVLDHLESDLAIGKLTVKKSWSTTTPFYRMKVRLKEEIVRLGKPEINPNNMVGQYVAPADWNALISDPEVTVIDTRNTYEFELGTFQRAIEPETDHFREFPDFVQKNMSGDKNRKIAMFCTGGIRCEKATALLREEGFQNIFHLQGGILNYLEKVDPKESLWEGDCFVFDNRVTVDHHLQPGLFTSCPSCRHALSPEDLESPHYLKGIACPYCYESQTTDQRQRATERQRQIELSQQHGRSHLGASPDDLEQWRQSKLASRTQSHNDPDDH